MTMVFLFLFTILFLYETIRANNSISKPRNAFLQKYTVQKNDAWESLFQNEIWRDIAKRINKRNTRLKTGETILIPKTFEGVNTETFSPLPEELLIFSYKDYRKFILIVQDELYWGAYENGKKIKSGPVSCGKSGYRTPNGEYKIYRKTGYNFSSKKYPPPAGSGPNMPWAMFFRGGYALHGSKQVPGYNASHGCIRLFIEDAEWLNKNFAEIGIKVIIVKSLSEIKSS